MSQDESGIPKPPRKRAGRPNELPAPSDVSPPISRPTPTDRLVEMTRDRIISLEQDKKRLIQREEQLHAELRRVEPENARLQEALRNAVANNVLSSVLVAAGGGAMGFAPFLGGIQAAVAFAGAATLVAGILILVTSTVRGRGVAGSSRIKDTVGSFDPNQGS